MRRLLRVALYRWSLDYWVLQYVTIRFEVLGADPIRILLSNRIRILRSDHLRILGSDPIRVIRSNRIRIRSDTNPKIELDWNPRIRSDSKFIVNDLRNNYQKSYQNIKIFKVIIPTIKSHIKYIFLSFRCK